MILESLLLGLWADPVSYGVVVVKCSRAGEERGELNWLLLGSERISPKTRLLQHLSRVVTSNKRALTFTAHFRHSIKN